MRVPVLAAFVALWALAAAPASAQQVYAPYEISVFRTAPLKSLSGAGAIAVAGGNVYVAYNNDHKPDGAVGNAAIVEFLPDGRYHIIQGVPGYNNALKVNPATGDLWALQTKNGVPILAVIDLKTRAMQTHFIANKSHGGGYDDVLFLHGKIYFTVSHPLQSPNTPPAIVSATVGTPWVTVEPVLSAGADAVDMETGKTVKLNLLDPHAITADPLGNVVFTSPANDELIVVNAIGTADQRVLRLLFGHPTDRVRVGVTAFATTTRGYLLIVDTEMNTVYKLTREAFMPGTAFGTTRRPYRGGCISTLDPATGTVSTIVPHLPHPAGMVFVSTGQ